MLDQSFSTENLRRLYDIQNRKGVNLAERFFPEVHRATKEWLEIRYALRIFDQKNATPLCTSLASQRETIVQRINRWDSEREALLMARMETISKAISSGEFPLTLTQTTTKRAGTVFTIPNDGATAAIHSFFALKQIQSNVEQLYKIRQGNRNLITQQLKLLLNDGFPKLVIRTDITAFYESIPRANLIQRLAADSLLSTTSQKVLKKILSTYLQMTGSVNGLPRGVGVSAHLSELYMRDVDSAIKFHPSVIYYARYVDDIVVIFSISGGVTDSDRLAFLDEVFDRYGLSRNVGKTFIAPTQTVTFDYLGYKYTLAGSQWGLSISEKRFRRYRLRIRKCFTLHTKQAARNKSSANALLLKRIRFLTGNTHLCNNKSNARVGIHFSNVHITDLNMLSKLDHYLSVKAGQLSDRQLAVRLTALTFVSGFTGKRYHQFRIQELTAITKAWKYA